MTELLDTNSLWRVRALIRHSALIHNIASIRDVAGEAQIYAVVKADAYGHGTEQLAKCASLVDGFAVATIEEGIALRALVQNTIPIMVLSEFNHPAQIQLFIKHQLQLVIHKTIQLDWLESYDRERGKDKLYGWIKFDTGMTRLGLPIYSAESLIQRFLQLENVQHCGVMSHLASADQPGCGQTAAQFEAFSDLNRFALPIMSLSNSAGLLTIGTRNQSMVRPGILLYGISPMAQQSELDINLVPAMTLQSKLIDVKKIDAGQTVGYGGTWTAKTSGQIGIVACGYADGYPRLASNRGQVMIGFQPADIVGRVSMDTMAVNLSNHPSAAAGDIVELWGEQISVSRVASWANTIPYELLCQVGNRVPRVAVD